MRGPITILLLLLPLGVWLTRVEVVGKKPPLGHAPAVAVRADPWRRTDRGWEDLRTWTWTNPRPQPARGPLHPALVAGMELLLSLAALLVADERRQPLAT